MRLKITSSGQVSIPAAIRRRWGSSTVVAVDEGDQLILRPAPDDPIEAAQGLFAAERKRAGSLEQGRRDHRDQEAERIAGRGPAGDPGAPGGGD